MAKQIEMELDLVLTSECLTLGLDEGTVESEGGRLGSEDG